MPALPSTPPYSLTFGNCQPESLCRLVSSFVGKLGSTEPAKSRQLRYLTRYLGAECLACKGYVCETHYIDKDYIDDFAGFYAKSLRQYPNFCWRVHFFTDSVKEEQLRGVFQEMKNRSTDAKESQLEKLNLSYRGYVVLRPHPKAFVGKSVLAPPPGTTGQIVKCCRRYETHLAGIPLSLVAIAFQQQDRTHSACATAAIWTALQKTAYEADLLVPSPRKITEAATRYSLNRRPVPNQGLTIQQVCEAIRSFGLDPEVYSTEERPDLCRDILQSCLCSEIPVIAALAKEPKTKGEAHAVAVVGYEDNSTLTMAEYGDRKKAPFNVAMASAGLVPKGLCITKFYAHDDRIGPYTEFTFEAGSNSRITLRDGGDGSTAPENWYVTKLIVPVHPKVRIDFTDVMLAVYPLILGLHKRYPDVGLAGSSIQARIMRGTDYARDVIRFAADASAAYNVLSECDFPKYVWVVRAAKSGSSVLDLVCDPTDSRLGSFIHGLVLYGERWRSHEAEIESTQELQHFAVWTCV